MSKSRTYNFHGLLSIRVVSGTPVFLDYLDRQLGHLGSDSMIRQPDIEISLRRFDWHPNSQTVRVQKYYVTAEHIYWKDHYKLGAWRVLLSGLDSDTLKVLFHGNRFSPKYLFMHILEPLIHYRLCLSGAILLHASSVADGKNAYVFPAMMGTGKTSMMLYLLEQGMNEFLADDFVILSDDCYVYSYPTPVSLFDYNVAANPFLRQRVAPRQRFLIRWNSLLYSLSLGKVKPVVAVDIKQLFPNVEIPSRRILSSIALLVRTEGDSLLVETVTNKHELAHKLININRVEFRFLRGGLEGYSYVNPASKVSTYENLFHQNLLKILEKVPCYEIHLPRKFRFRSDTLGDDLKQIIEVCKH